jgi:putative FmdB family regulatory protein
MPIYAYKCASCGHAKDVLQKMSDAPLTTCPSCGAQSFSKQLTAAGFQLKGSGWYATDFRGGAGAAAPASATPAADSPAPAPAAADSGGASTSAAGGCGTSCACH